MQQPKDIEPVIDDDIEVVVEKPTLDAEITMSDVVLDTTEIAQPSEEISEASEMSGAVAFMVPGGGSPFGTNGTQGIGRGPGGLVAFPVQDRLVRPRRQSTPPYAGLPAIKARMVNGTSMAIRLIVP